jgi:glutathione S-transferase
MHRPIDGGEAVVVNQVGACMIYLGDVLGYAPQSLSEKARANAILLSALDYISEGRRTFHPIKDKMSYADQKEEGDKVSKEWSQSRMKIYLAHFNKLVECNALVHDRGDCPSAYTKPIAGGSSLTYADFALFHVLHATEVQFNTPFYNMVWDRLSSDDVKPLHSWYTWMKSRPNLVAYFESDRAAPFSGDSMM